MRDDDPPPPATRATRLFSVRVWKEEMTGGSEYRGSVRDVVTQAFRGFREWSDLVAFMVAEIERDDGAPGGARKEHRDVNR